jgi:RNase H-fold protein (predicted Holliday junction resolvase)
MSSPNQALHSAHTHIANFAQIWHLMNQSSTHILGIDPGRQKTGLALIDAAGLIVWRTIASTPELGPVLSEILEKWPVSRVALGHSTGSEAAATLIKAVLAERGSDAVLEIVNERDSTLEARSLYFEAYPPRGLSRLVPQSLLCPPVPIDDFAAAILARRAQATGRGSGEVDSSP